MRPADKIKTLGRKRKRKKNMRGVGFGFEVWAFLDVDIVNWMEPDGIIPFAHGMAISMPSCTSR